MLRVKLLQKVGQFRKGQVVRFDPVSARKLVESGRGELVHDEPTAFDPSDHDAKAVRKYLADASPAEKHRVLSAERAGKARSTVLSA